MENVTFKILVENANETTLSIPVHAQMTVYELKKVIRHWTNELVKNQKLFYDGNEMKFHGWALSLYGIENVPGVTHKIKLKVFHENLIQTLLLKHIHAAIGEEYLSPKWHVDLRNVTDSGKTRLRGGCEYNRPVGCMRFAIRVLDRYEDSKWIGLKGVERIQTNTHGEWPVAYHGTNEQSVLSILEEGFRLDMGQRFTYGKGVYCTPDPLTALAYAFTSVYQGEELRLIIQCRVDPTKVQVVAKPAGYGEYWLVPSGQDIRPYAVCAYEKLLAPPQPLVSVQQSSALPQVAVQQKWSRHQVSVRQKSARHQASVQQKWSRHQVSVQHRSARHMTSAQNSTYQQQNNAIHSQSMTLPRNRNIYPGAPTNSTLKSILKSGNPLASQAPAFRR